MTRGGRLRRPVLAAAGVAVVVASACADGTGPGIASSISVSPTEATVTSGQTLQMSVSLKDVSGNELPTSAITWTSSDVGIATVSPTGLVTARGAGGPVMVAAHAGSMTAQALITVVSGGATQLSMATQPSAAGTSGVVLDRQPVVQLRDAAGNAAAASGIQVTAVLAEGEGTLSNAAAITGSDGRASFAGVTITGGSGVYRLRFEATGLTPATSDVVALSTGIPSELSILTQPSATAQSSVPFARQPSVEVRDAGDNPVAGVGVTASVATGGGTVGGSATAITNASGVATFSNLAISGLVGSRTLEFTSGAATEISASIQLQAGPLAQFVVATQPSSNATNDVAFPQQPVVRASDAAGNAIGSVSVTAAIQSGGGSIGGTVMVSTNASGDAAFTNLKITGLVGSRTLRFANGGISVTSNTVNLSAGVPTSANLLTEPPDFTFSGHVFTPAPVVEVRDVSGNLVSGAQVVASIQSGGGSLVGATDVTTNGSGVATFSSLSISGSVGARTLRFATGSGQATSTVNVSYGEGTQTLTYCGSQLMDVFVPDESFVRPLPVAVHIHGGAWVSGDRFSGLLLPELKSELLARGYVVVSLDYRLADGTAANYWPAQIHDVKCAIRHLRAQAGEYGADGRIGVWGASAGGHLASMLAVTDAFSGLEGNAGYSGVSSHVDAVAPIGAISDITDAPGHPELAFAGPEETFATWPDAQFDASPIEWATSGDAPFYIVHGDQDGTVLYPQATKLRDALLSAGASPQLLTVVNGGHNLNDVGLGTPSHTLGQVADLIADFFDLHVLN